MGKEIILIGSGGCMREIAWQIWELNQKTDTWNIVGYVDREPPADEDSIQVGQQVIPYLGNDDFLLRQQEAVNVVVCVGEPALRKKISEKLQANPNICFPNLILGDTRICSDVKMGIGCIVSMDARISTNVTLGNFVFLNIGSVICHDGRIGDYVTLSPDARLAGSVAVADGCDIGLGTKIIQGISIGKNTVTGAGSVVIRDISGNCTVAGVPAKKIRGNP